MGYLQSGKTMGTTHSWIMKVKFEMEVDDVSLDILAESFSFGLGKCIVTEYRYEFEKVYYQLRDLGALPNQKLIQITPEYEDKRQRNTIRGFWTELERLKNVCKSHRIHQRTAITWLQDFAPFHYRKKLRMAMWHSFLGWLKTFL